MPPGCELTGNPNDHEREKGARQSHHQGKGACQRGIQILQGFLPNQHASCPNLLAAQKCRGNIGGGGHQKHNDDASAQPRELER